jgi:hypothetical protein
MELTLWVERKRPVIPHLDPRLHSAAHSPLTDQNPSSRLNTGRQLH